MLVAIAPMLRHLGYGFYSCNSRPNPDRVDPVVVSYSESRGVLVHQLKAAGAIRSAAVERAFVLVPRHAFLPDAATAGYADRAIVVKRDSGGQPVSSASQPTMMAHMLEQLRVVAGNAVLEVGTGTGYNAALLAELVGGRGRVVSVEVDADLADQAARRLDRLGFGRVAVVVADGRDGFAAGAPYDRIIVTAGATVLAGAWRSQLAEGGRLVVPVVDADGIGVSVSFGKVGGELVRQDEQPCGFLLLRDA